MTSAHTLVRIQPGDPSYLTHLAILTALSVGLTGIILSEPGSSKTTLLRFAFLFPFSIGTFALLYQRNITLQRACALRLTYDETQYDELMKNKIVLTAKGMSTIFQLLFTTSILSNLPLLYIRLMDGNVMQWVYKADSILVWWFVAINVTVCSACWIMLLTQGELLFDFNQPVKSNEPPLSKLDFSMKKHKEDADGWVKVASTSRRHDLWVKPVTTSSDAQAERLFEVTTRLASNHPQYNPDKHAEPAGPILHITLP